MEIFLELGLIIVVTTVITGIVWLLKQPLIIGYILAGIVLGPHVFNIVRSTEIITAFSHIGVSLLLFIVGLNMSPKVIKEVGKVSLVTGIGQVVFTSVIGFLICKALGFPTVVSAYVATALTFSSTIIIMKLLSDKGDIETLYGRIAIGFLIVQDLIAILILIVISSTSNGLRLTPSVFRPILGGFGLLALLFAGGIYVLPTITKAIAKSQEFLLLFSMGWCLALASLFHYLNFSMEIGAILAGMTLSLSPYRHEISSKMRQLRDFFIVLFFILLGSQMEFASATPYLIPLMILSAFVLIGNPFIVMILMGSLGYTKRNSFLAGLTVAQISEFSLILIALGIKVGHLTNEVLSLVTAVGLITIGGSSYMILYSNKIYPHVSKYLGIFERKGKKVDEHKYHEYDAYDIILFGCNRIGYNFLELSKNLKNKFLVVDYNPEIVISLSKEGVDCRYGDASDTEFLNELNFSKVKMIVSTIPDFDTNLLLINKIKESNKEAIIFVVSHQIDDAIELYDKGATYVIMPHFLGAHHASTLIQTFGLDYARFLAEKATHIEELKNRRRIGHEHPKHERH